MESKDLVTKSEKIRLYWVEEQEIYQKLFKAIFDAQSPFDVVQTGVFSDFKGVDRDLKTAGVDILLVGCSNVAPEMLGNLENIRKTYPVLGIVILAGVLKYQDVSALKSFINGSRSAFGIIFKKSLSDTVQIYNTLKLVNTGQTVIDPKLANLITTEKEKAKLSGGLTTREMEVLNLIARGYTNVAISESLCIDVKTVRHHINNLYSKLKTSVEFDNRHPRVSATNIYLRLTGQLTLDDQAGLD